MLGVKIPALPASLRRTNQRTVISLLLRLGSASRADLAKVAGISQPTAGKITTELLQLGIMQEAGLTASDGTNGANGTPRLGRPGQLLQLDNRHPRFLAVEIGVSETCVSALPVAVKLEDEWAFRFPTRKSPEDWLKELKRATAQVPHRQLWGVLISVPGIVDESAGTVLFSPNLHWLEKTHLPQLVQQMWDLPVLVIQEIQALALGHLTAEPAGEGFFLVDFGQGVGGAIVSDGQLHSRPTPLNGELGHTPVAGNRRRCGCGAIGCLETLVSQRGLLQSLAEAEGQRAAGNRQQTGGRVSETAAAWNGLVRHVNEHGLEPWLAETLSATARVIDGALNVLGIHRVVVTGSLNDLPGFALKHLSDEVKRGALWARFGEVTCQSATRRRAAGLVAFGLDRLVLPADEESSVLLPRSKRARQRSNFFR
jgi:predicted NBD/HSP70 family sugar kinase